MKYFAGINCKNTETGNILRWTMRKESAASSFCIYRLTAGHAWELLVADYKMLYFNDPTIDGTPDRHNSYKVSAVGENGILEVSDPISPMYDEGKNRCIATAIRRRENIYYKRNPCAADVHILMLAKAGGKCPVCYNREMGMSANPSCPQCMGTGFEGGYVRWPETVRMMRIKEEIKNVGSDTNLKQEHVTTFRTVFEGFLEERDVFLIGNTAWRIMEWAPTIFVGGSPIVYTITTYQVLPGSVIYAGVERELNQG